MKKCVCTVLIVSVFFLVAGCSGKKVTDENAKVKESAINAVNDYCINNVIKEMKAFEIKEVSSCVVTSNQAITKINVVLKGKDGVENKSATVVLEKEAGGKWVSKSVLLD